MLRLEVYKVPIEGYAAHDERTLEILANNREVMKTGEGVMQFDYAFIDLVASCQYSCKGCFNQEENALGVSLDWEKLTGAVDFLVERGGRKITFAGSGEPLLDPHLVPLVRYARERDIGAVLFTTLTRKDADGNIVPVDEETLQQLYDLDIWLVGKRSHLNNAEQARVLGVPGSNAGKVIYEGIDRAVQAGFADRGRFLIDSPIDRQTLGNIPDILRFVRSRGIQPYFESYIVHGQDKNAIKSLSITRDELRGLFAELQRIDRDEFGIETQLRPNMRIYVADPCDRPEYGFTIKATGEVRTCPTDYKTAIGNVNLENGLATKEALAKILSPDNSLYVSKFGCFGCSQKC